VESGRNSFFSFFSSAKPSFSFSKNLGKIRLQRERRKPPLFCTCFFWLLVLGGSWLGFIQKQAKLLVTQKKRRKILSLYKLRVWNARGREREIEESLSYTHTHTSIVS